MMVSPIAGSVGSVFVNTTQNRGFTPEEVAQHCVDKIISVGNDSHPAIREQAIAFKESIQSIVTFYIKEAIRNDRATLAAQLNLPILLEN
jgi:hypothetical protein